MDYRVGSGFDLHRLKAGRPFVLGCVRIDWPEGPYGHSDGDPLAHALADALLGVDGEEEFVIYAAPVGKVAGP